MPDRAILFVDGSNWYHALADQPLRVASVSDVLAFERELTTVREKLRDLEEDADPSREGAPWD